MKLSEELQWRGFLNQSSFSKLNELDQTKKITFYHGYDASADSLTIGNLAAIMLDKLFIKHGHKAIILAGGATSLIGDPGGKESERLVQSPQTIDKNVAAIEKQIKTILGDQARLVNNLDWFKDQHLISFLIEIGKQFSMTPLVQRDYIARRIGEGGSGLSYAEFSYTILQGYDYLHLYRNFGVTLQLAGSDQWGNGLSGLELIRKLEGAYVNVLTMPLIVDQSTGRKFGKSESGAVWLDPKKTDPIESFYQFWVNTNDQDLEGLLKIFTELDRDEISQVVNDSAKDLSARSGQKRLAWEVTALVHGSKVADQSLDYAKSLKSGAKLKRAEVQIKVKDGASVIDVLVESGLSSSKSEARQVMDAGGIYINDKPSRQSNFSSQDFKDGLLKLRKGKKLSNVVVVEIEIK